MITAGWAAIIAGEQVIEVGANALILGTLLITTLGTLATLIVNTVLSNRGKRASESASAQLTNNGGSTALDKLQLGQSIVSEQVTQLATDLGQRLDQHDEQLAAILGVPILDPSTSTSTAVAVSVELPPPAPGA